MNNRKEFRFCNSIGLRSVCFLLTLSALGAGILLFGGPRQERRFERIGPYGGTVRSLLISAGNSSIVYLGTNDGQLFKSNDGGASWKLLYPGIKRRQFAIDSIVQDPINADHLYVGGWDLRSDGGGLFESKDGGRTWNQVILPDANVAVRGFAISSGHPDHMIAGTGCGVFVSADGGKSWLRRGQKIDAFRQSESVAINPKDPNILFVGTWHLGYRSRDFGRTWELIDRGMISDSDVFSIRIDERDPKVIFASACTGLYWSADNGTSWTRLRVFPKSYLVRAQVVVLDPNKSERVYAGTTEGLFLSRNSGQTWERVTTNDLTINAIQVDPADSNVILAGTELHGVLRSGDGGHTWTKSNTGFVNRSITRILPDPERSGRLVVGEMFEGKLGGFYLYDSPVDDWVKLDAREVPGAGMFSFSVLPGNLGLLAGTAYGAFLQQNPSTGWIRLPGPISNLTVYDLAVDGSGERVFAGTNDGIYRASLKELLFEKPPRYSFIPRVFSILPSRGNSGLIFAGTHLGVLRSSDSGSTWQVSSQGIPDHTTVECLVSGPEDGNLLFAGTSSGLYRSQDNGNTWKRVEDALLNVDISSIIFLDSAGRRILAGDNTFGGVLLSEDGGGHWIKIEDPQFGSPVRTLMQDPNHASVIYLGTGTEGVYRLSMPE